MNTTCANCGKAIKVKPSMMKPDGNYCSKACWYASGTPRPARMNGQEKSCEVCGGKFYVSKARADAKFCSQKCKGVASRLAEKACEVCGKIFKPRMGRADQPCCSRECGYIYRHKRDEQPCETCGKLFRPERDDHRFCSKPCFDIWFGRNKTDHTCKICGKAFRWSPSRSKAYNVTYCSIACRDADPDRRDMLIAMNATQQRMRPNHVERAAYAILDDLGIEYDPQHLVGGKFCVDAFVASANLVIQFDGDYWHGNPAKFPDPDARQKRRMTLDKSQDAYMAACGYTVMRFWASDIQRNPEIIKTKLLPLLTQP